MREEPEDEIPYLEEYPEDPEEAMLMEQAIAEERKAERIAALSGGLPGVPASVSGRRATLTQAWNKTQAGTVITTDPSADGQLVDDARFDALEQGGFFGRDSKEIMGELHAMNSSNPPATAKADWSVPPGDITGDPVVMGEPRPPTESEIAYGEPRPPTESEIAYGRKLAKQRKESPKMPPVDEEDGA